LTPCDADTISRPDFHAMTYEYICTSCGHEWEASQSIKDEPLKSCPSCKKRTAKRQISGGTGFVLKGGGWYADLYGSAKPSKSNGGDDASASSSDDSKADAKKDSKKADTKKADAKKESKPKSSTKGSASAD